MENKKETAPEVPVQEQHLVAIIGFDEDVLNKKLERINTLAKELKSEIKSLPSSIKVTYQNF